MGWGQILGSAVGGFFGGPLGAGIGAGLGGSVDQNSANAYNSAEAATNRNFQASQSATSYQRAMADMKAAGLNPMLAYSQGGASVPVGSAASFSNNVDSSGSNQSHVQSAQAAQRSSEASSVSANAAQQQAMAAVTQATTQQAKAEAEITLIKLNGDQVIEQVRTMKHSQSQLMASAQMLHAQMKLMEKQGISEAIRSDVLTQTAAKIISETQLNNLDLDAAQKLGNIGRGMKELEPILRIFMDIFGSRRR